MLRLGRAMLLQVLLMLSATAEPPQEFTRRSVALDGDWEFTLDPQRIGTAKGWHTGQYPLPHRCPVPGAWEAAGFGDATERIWHSYTPTNATMDELYHIGAGRNTSMGGLAWYRRNISLPAAEAGDGQLLFLRVGGVHRQVTAYANGVYLGHHVGYLHELEWDVTAAVAAAAAGGRSSLAVVLAVDSFHDMTIDPLIGAFDMGEIPSLNARLSSGGAALEGLSGPWGGIWGHVALEWRRRTWLAEMFAQATNATVVATAALHGAPTEGSGDHVQLEVFDCSTGQMVATSTAQLDHALDPATQQLSVRAVIPEADLQRWSPSAPALYNATLTLLSSSAPGSLPTATDSLTVRFGVKDLRIVGHQFVLNGRKIFLSGFGMDSSFADTIAAPSDKAYYLRRWQLAKSFGFNFVRCHSGFYPPELYAAADEVGMFVSPELPIIGDTYYNAALRLNSTFAYHGAWRAVITRFRNHPS
jgi:beta-galactosidase/beta-glucuronidase